MAYEFLAHTADVKFKASGNTIEEMFIEASRALNETIRGDITVLEISEKKIKVSGKDKEELLHNFLEEFLFLLDSEDFLASKIKEIKIDIEKLSLEADILGDKADNYKFTNDVKAITYSEMYVKETEGKWECQVVLDV